MHGAVLFQTAFWLQQGREAGAMRTAGRRGASENKVRRRPWVTMEGRSCLVYTGGF